MKKPRTSVTKCMTLRLLYTSSLTGLLTDCKLATPSAARLLLYSYVQRNVNVQDNTTQYLEKVWVACALYELRIAFDYCSLHVSTVISHSALWFSSSSHKGLCQCRMDYIINIELVHTPALIKVGLMALLNIGPEICVASLITVIRNHVDKNVITKHYYQLIPLRLATYKV
ncbi:hypothetical protein T09_12289 [Trichinella sp. T9]|nr:hypothetical protein T09_12289 [Trichinella sp. T9]